ncbi:MAG: hypothetical protein HY903_24015 [Deltaproteobacteria bacterium]|nr:hypothetical protein [Deltaproteobacteria bacterium]
MTRVLGEASVSDCPNGGVVLAQGIDQNGNGLLEDVEIQDTVVVCHGTNGADGHDTLVTTTPIDAGAACPGGGTRVEAGLDVNDDGVLSSDEVQTTQNVCSGADGQDGQDGATVLIRLDTTPPSGSCPNGGTTVSSGVDVNEDRQLQSTEITATSTLCNGADGAAGQDGATVLLRLDTTSPSDSCPNGGTTVNSGVDVNDDGQLQDTEITTSSTVCNGLPRGTVLTGSFTIANDMDLAALSSYQEITGDLIVRANGLTAVRLPNLLKIGGELDVDDSAVLAAIELPKLTEVGRNLDVNASALTSFDASGLVSVGGYFYLHSGQVASLGLSSLHDVASMFALVGIKQLSIVLGALVEVGGAVQLSSLESPDVDFPVLEAAGWLVLNGISVGVGATEDAVLSFPVLTDVASGVQLAALDQTVVDLPLLASVGGGVYLNGLTNMSISIPTLVGVSGDVGIETVQLSELSFPALDHVGGGWRVSGSNIGTVDLAALRVVHDMAWTSVQTLTGLSLPALANVQASFSVRGMPALTSLSVPQLSTIPGSFTLSDNSSLPTLAGFSLLQTVSYLDLAGNAALVDLGLSALDSVSGWISIHDNPLSECKIEAFAARLSLAPANDAVWISTGYVPCDGVTCSTGRCVVDCSVPEEYQCWSTFHEPQVAAGGRSSCGVRADGTVACWGWSSSGLNGGPAGRVWQKVRMSERWDSPSLCGLTQDFQVRCWGAGFTDQSMLERSSGVSDVCVGGSHACVVRTGGASVCVPSWTFGDLYGESLAPSGAFTKIACGEHHTCAIVTDGSIACWGLNHLGQTVAPTTGSYVGIAARLHTTCAIRDDATLVCWGDEDARHLTSGVPAGAYKAVTVGHGFACAIRVSDDNVVCWGDGAASVQPTGAYSLIDAGIYHMCGIATDHSAACWGADNYGQATVPVGFP